jgi:hypothetical protein
MLFKVSTAIVQEIYSAQIPMFSADCSARTICRLNILKNYTPASWQDLWALYYTILTTLQPVVGASAAFFHFLNPVQSADSLDRGSAYRKVSTYTKLN